MPTATTTTLSSMFSLLLALAVILSGAHAKDLSSLTVDHSHADVKVFNDDGRTKLGGDLHNHVDKSTLKAVGDSLQADPRSLRLVQHNRKQMSAELFGWLQFAVWRLGNLF